jgi:hypothetical protein
MGPRASLDIFSEEENLLPLVCSNPGPFIGVVPSREVVVNCSKLSSHKVGTVLVYRLGKFGLFRGTVPSGKVGCFKVPFGRVVGCFKVRSRKTVVEYFKVPSEKIVDCVKYRMGKFWTVLRYHLKNLTI